MVATLLTSEAVLEDALAIGRIAAPPFGEQARGDEVERRLRTMPGFNVRRDAVGNVIALRGESTADAVWAIAHLDTVFPVEEEMRFERSDGLVRGPGIGDNALAIAALLALAHDSSSWPSRRPLALVFSVGEEGLGDLRGVRALLESGVVRSPRAVLAVEGHRLDALGTIAVGSVRYRGRISGPGGHSWSDRGRASATHALVAFGARLLQAPERIDGGLSVNLGTIEGGSYVTAIAAEASITFEARSTSEEHIESFARFVDNAARASELPVRLEEVGRRPAGILPVSHPLVAAAQAARIEEGLPAAALVANSTDANAFLAAGIPALAIGLTNGRNAHHPTEEIEIAPIASGVAVLRRLLMTLIAS